jgi:hypothetical protein
VHQAQSSSHLSITRYGNEKLQFNALHRPHLSKPIPQRDTPQYYYSRNQPSNQFPYPLSIPPHSRPKCRSPPPIKRHSPKQRPLDQTICATSRSRIPDSLLLISLFEPKSRAAASLPSRTQPGRRNPRLARKKPYWLVLRCAARQYASRGTNRYCRVGSREKVNRSSFACDKGDKRACACSKRGLLSLRFLSRSR